MVVVVVLSLDEPSPGATLSFVVVLDEPSGRTVRERLLAETPPLLFWRTVSRVRVSLPSELQVFERVDSVTVAPGAGTGGASVSG